jgi:hypothetical protein
MSQAQAEVVEFILEIAAGRNSPGRATTGRQDKEKPIKHWGRHPTGGYGPNDEIAAPHGRWTEDIKKMTERRREKLTERRREHRG